jgi:NADH-quinone oxidoreductase subunit H
MSVVPAFLAFSVVPFGPEVSIAGHHTALQLTDLPVGVLFILACSSLGVYGIILSGWSSGSTYPLLGALRSAAQVISYEVGMGLALVPVFIYAGTLSTSGIVASQQDHWYFWSLPVSFVIYVICMVGETNRAPFDLPEAESELVGGFHTEYSSFKFAMFFLAEYINMVTVSALATTLFLGGWHAPWPVHEIWAGANSNWWPIVWFTAKVILFIFGFVWLRGTLPRMRYDQFMHLGWKVLIPVNLVWIMVVASLHVLGHVEPVGFWNLFLGLGGALILLVVIGGMMLEGNTRRRNEELDELDEEEARLGPTFPTPPLNLVVPKPPRVASATRARAALDDRTGVARGGDNDG